MLIRDGFAYYTIILGKTTCLGDLRSNLMVLIEALATANVALLVSLSNGQSALPTLLTFVERASFGVINSRIMLNLRHIAFENNTSNTQGPISYESISALVIGNQTGHTDTDTYVTNTTSVSERKDVIPVTHA